MADTFLWTAQDELERLLLTQEFTNQGRQRVLARTAIVTSLRDFANQTRWTYYNRRYLLQTVASQTGTAEYDHTGGASERLLTVADITLPTDGTGAFLRVIIGEVHYDIARVLSATTAQLTLASNPGEDVAAGTVATVYRALYPFPVGFRKLCHVWDVDDERELPILLEDEWHAQAVGFFDTPDEPDWCAVVNAGELLGGMMLAFSAPPDSARTYDIMYEAGAQQIKTWKYSTGTYTSDGTDSVVITTGVPSEQHIGAVIRFTDHATIEPTPIVGDAAGNDNPYLYQRIILGVPIAGTYLVDEDVPADTAKKYVVSDPIDIENGAMLSAFQRACDAEYASLLRTKDWADRAAAARRATLQAMEADQRSTYARRNAPPYYDRFYNPRTTTDDS